MKASDEWYLLTSLVSFGYSHHELSELVYVLKELSYRNPDSPLIQQWIDHFEKKLERIHAPTQPRLL